MVQNNSQRKTPFDFFFFFFAGTKILPIILKTREITFLFIEKKKKTHKIDKQLNVFFSILFVIFNERNPFF